MIAHLPLLLALTGTALTALAIFAPPRAVVAPTVSFAPPLAPPFVPPPPLAPTPEGWSPERWAPEHWAPERSLHETTLHETTLHETTPHEPEPQPVEPAWPELLDASARACDAAARLALVEALAIVDAPWAAAILRRAQAEELDAEVRAALDAALRG